MPFNSLELELLSSFRNVSHFSSSLEPRICLEPRFPDFYIQRRAGFPELIPKLLALVLTISKALFLFVRFKSVLGIYARCIDEHSLALR